MTQFLKSISASISLSGQLTQFRWYTGAFKAFSIGTLRAISRATSNFITQPSGK